jgi:hypothetical protein
VFSEQGAQTFGGRVVRSFLAVMASAVLLAGCAHQQQYVRTDGAPVNGEKELLLSRLVLVATVQDYWSGNERKMPLSTPAWPVTGTFILSRAVLLVMVMNLDLGGTTYV